MSDKREIASVCNELDRVLFGGHRDTGTEWISPGHRYNYLLHYIRDLKASHDLLRKDRQLLEWWLKEAQEKK